MDFSGSSRAGISLSFLSPTFGASFIGYWGNVCRLCILFNVAPLDGVNGGQPNAPPEYYGTWVDLKFRTTPAGMGVEFYQWVGGPPPQAWTLPSIALVADLDGDGLLDAIDTQDGLHFTAKDLSAKSDANHLTPFGVIPFGAAALGHFNTTPGQVFPGYDPGWLVDMNGDGLPDYLTTINAGTQQEQYVYYPGDGTGGFGCVQLTLTNVCNTDPKGAVMYPCRLLARTFSAGSTTPIPT